uniref:Uncharacterized protein n=1 Tax=Candidatus Kentrum sp. TUN TaxID=2126343 RepID=A0A451AVE0_9GAMM|nr:MAG: hypothetical protein BECKTUN1418F_GA0071002_12364 [Candidatus Kentron sp. TUN]VFK69867.1 MAG: hypothetical protein BECKTUN1418E_GA0071001_12175 [Candidatus Kentron sp. TUN]
MAEDIYSRKIVGWEVHERQNAEYASGLIRKGYLAEGIRRKGLVLQSSEISPIHTSWSAPFLVCCLRWLAQ